MIADVARACPYRNLYIYYLSGTFHPNQDFDPAHFIGVWHEAQSSFLFFTQPQMALVEKTVNRQPDLELLDHFHMTYDQWQGGEILPFCLGRFTITPPWLAADPVNTDSTIILDPGVVFGNGSHPTTQDCMQALQLALADQTMRAVLDLGTGTGLLAVAAARLGCPNVLAVDLTLLAAQTACRNVRHNRLTDQILVVQGDAEKFIDFTSDLVVSNIHYDVMKNLIATPGFLKKKRFILSGLMRSEAAHIESTLADMPVEIIRRWNRDDIWHTFYGRIA